MTVDIGTGILITIGLIVSVQSFPSEYPFAQPLKDGSCGDVRVNLVDGDHGFLSSPSYPRSYWGGLDCEWRLEGVPGSVIQATIFDLRTQNAILSDISDSLYVSSNRNWNESQRFSGDLTPITPMILLSEGNFLAFRFRTSRFTQGNKGFRIGYFVRESSTGKPAVSEPAHDAYTVIVCNYVPVDHPQVFPETGISLRLPQAIDGINRVNQYPYMVALMLDDNQFCAGTLISDSHVVTSAHCTRGVKTMRLVLGTDNLSYNDTGVQRRNATSTSVTQHPNFDPYTGENDLSVIQLDPPVEITRFVVPAALPTWAFLATTFTGYKGEIVGWGDSTTGTVYAQAGKKLVKISPNPTCSLKNRGYNGLSMCSQRSQGSECQADSGSPIIASRAYCVAGDGDRPNKPGRPEKPGKPNKPSKPSRPSKPNRPNSRDEPRHQANILLGLVSHGSCDKGFSFTRITSQLDFLQKFVLVHSDAEI